MNPLAILRLVPAWLWAVAAALAWGAWQHHLASEAGRRALQAQRELADLQAGAARTALQTLARTVAAHQEIAHDAEQTAARDRADAAAAAAALRRLRDRAAAAGARACAAAPIAAGGAAAAGADLVPAELLSRLGERAGQLAALADERGRAGEACERAYRALTGSQP